MPPGRVVDAVSRMAVGPATPVVLDRWTGYYFGGHLGYGQGFGRNIWLDPDPATSEASFSSLFGGFQSGYNYLLPSRLLLGVEADATFPYFLSDGTVTIRQTSSSAVAEKLDFVSTLRGRVGYAFNDWLFYATAGFAWSRARFLEDPGVSADEDKLVRLRAGWAAGAGLELAIAPGWTARMEYLYDHLGTANGVFPSGTGYESTTIDVHNFRLGLNRQLDWASAAPMPGKVADQWAIDPNSWNIHGQFTFIEQGYPAIPLVLCRCE
jgi:high affinity Mn2+ porin